MKLYVLISFLVISFDSVSQIVNIENKRLTGNRQGFNGSIELNLDFTMNSKQLLQIGDKIQVSYVKKRNEFLIVTDHAFVKSVGDDFVNRGFQHLRYNYLLKDSGKFSFEVFQQGQFNKIQKINFRLLLGSGFRVNLINQNNHQLNVGTGFMAEYEELIDLGEYRDVLSTTYLSFDIQFNKSIGFNTISYFQPKLIDVGSYRFSNETSFRFLINRYLGFKFIYSLTHDNRHIPGVRKTNYTIENALQIKF